VNGLLATLVAAAAAVGALHAVAPDHWIPLAAVARAQKWSRARTARVTLLCGLGHVTVSAALGLLALFLGRAVLERFGAGLASIGGVLLVAFGLGYALYGLRHGAAHVHGHAHASYDHVHGASRATTASLFLVYAADPCVAVIPILVAAAPLGLAAAAGVVVLYETATVASMVGLVLCAHAGLRVLRGAWVERWGHGAAGGVIVLAGVVTAALGW
jgi:hypothetical protein